MISQGVRRCKGIALAECSTRDNRLFYNDRLYVPDHAPLKLKLLHMYHDDPAAGHPGRSKTITMLSRDYY